MLVEKDVDGRENWDKRETTFKGLIFILELMAFEPRYFDNANEAQEYANKFNFKERCKTIKEFRIQRMLFGDFPVDAYIWYNGRYTKAVIDNDSKEFYLPDRSVIIKW